MKTEERKKKFIIGLCLYTMGIIQIVVCWDVALDGGPWVLAVIGTCAYIPLSIIGSNLMLLSRWW